jgi:RecB family exonuclease
MPLPNLTEGIDWSKQKVVSFSQYNMYSQCQYRWYLEYVKKHKVFKPGVALVFGTSMHEVVQEYLRVMYNETATAADKLDLTGMLKERMYENYKTDLEQHGDHFIKPEEFKEHIEDGIQILEWLRKHRRAYFSVKDHELVGIEVPIQRPIVDDIPNVIMIGSIDFIIRDKRSDKYIVYDLKTSTKGWKDKDKKDQAKVDQVLFYKRFYSRLLNVPEDKIEVQFFIVRRKLYENCDFPIKRVQEFVPTQGKKKVEDAYTRLSDFVRNTFTPDAKYIDKPYPKNTSACKYCPFNDKPELCNKNS